MEWRPQKEGIATFLEPFRFFLNNFVKMEWRPQKEGIATPQEPRLRSRYPDDGMETSKRRDCDLLLFKIIFFPPLPVMEWRPQKEGIATRQACKIGATFFPE